MAKIINPNVQGVVTDTGGQVFNVKAYGATGTGPVGDDTAAIQRAFDAALPKGGVVYFPPGRYVVTTAITFNTSVANAPSLVVRGAGRFASVIDRRGAVNGFALEFKSITANVFQLGLVVEDLGIETTGGAAAFQGGIYIKGVYQAFLRNVRVSGMTGDGIQIDSPLGDPDASVNVTLESCFLWNSTLYGLRAVCGAGTANISYLALRGCSIQGNLAGGIYWTGAVCSIRDTGIAANKGVGGLYVDDVGSSNMNLEVTSSTFENNSPRHVDFKSLLAYVFTNCDFRHSLQATYPATDGVRILPSAARQVSKGVFISPNIFAVAAYTPYTFFAVDGSAAGANVSGLRVISPVWRNFDAAGQTRFSSAGAVNDLQRISPRYQSSTAIALIAGANQNVNIGKDAEYFILNGPAAACQLGGLTDGWEGRRITLLWTNASGIVLTLNSDDVGSVAANRLLMPGGANKVLPAFARVIIEFEWTAAGGAGGWWMRHVQTA